MPLEFSFFLAIITAAMCTAVVLVFCSLAALAKTDPWTPLTSAEGGSGLPVGSQDVSMT